MRKIIAVDFDRTLSIGDYDYPFLGTFNKNLAAYLIDQRELGALIILNTCRVGSALNVALEFCKENGLMFDYVNENSVDAIDFFGGDCRKIYADEYIDDKNIFNVVWNI